MPAPKIDPKIRKVIEDYTRQGLSEVKIVKLAKEKHGLKVSKGTIYNVRHQAALTPPVKANKKVGSLNWREWVPQIKVMQGLKRKASHSQDTAEVELGDGSEPVVLASFSDQHMGAWSTDYDALQRLTDELLSTPNLYIALLGDYAHYAIKLRNVLEVSDNMLPPEQQTDFMESWFEEIWPKVAFATWDNHGVERQEKQAGESSVKRTLSKKVIYFNGIGHVDVKVGEQVYRGAVSHRFRGNSFNNPVHGQQRYMRYEGQDRDWAMAGDTHVPGMCKYTDGARVKVAINSGNLQANSGYAKRYFSLATHPVYPVIVFHPDQHLMSPFWSVKEYLENKR